MKHARNTRKAILIIWMAAITTADTGRADVQIYGIGILAPGERTAALLEGVDGPGLPQEIARYSGGRFFEVNDPRDLSQIALEIGAALRNQYLLGYAPSAESRDGGFHGVTVKLDPPVGAPKLRTTFRSAYLAPAQ